MEEVVAVEVQLLQAEVAAPAAPAAVHLLVTEQARGSQRQHQMAVAVVPVEQIIPHTMLQVVVEAQTLQEVMSTWRGKREVSEAYRITSEVGAEAPVVHHRVVGVEALVVWEPQVQPALRLVVEVAALGQT